MSREVPERHSREIERQDRKDNLKEAEAKFDELREKHGEATATSDNGNTVTGADCPDCKEGVIVVTPEKTSYPPYRKVCTECGEKK